MCVKNFGWSKMAFTIFFGNDLTKTEDKKDKKMRKG